VLGSGLCCSVLQCVAVCCSVLQCVAVCCGVLRGMACAWCGVLRCVALRFILFQRVVGESQRVLQCAAV